MHPISSTTKGLRATSHILLGEVVLHQDIFDFLLNHLFDIFIDLTALGFSAQIGWRLRKRHARSLVVQLISHDLF